MNVQSFSDVTALPMFSILFYVADLCNYNCNYCYNIKPRIGNVLSVESIITFIQHIKMLTHLPLSVDLIGGEPTTRADLVEIVEKLSLLCDHVLIYTNLSADLQTYIKLLSIKNVVLYATWHHQNVLFLSKLDELSMYHSKIDVSVMYEHGHLHEALKTYQHITRQSTFASTCFALVDSNPAFYQQQDIQKYNDVLTIDSELNYSVKINGIEQLMSEEQIVNSHINDFHLWKCNAGYDALYVHRDGNIFPCQTYMTYQRPPIGNIKLFKHLQLKPVICPFNTCECGLSIEKHRIF